MSFSGRAKYSECRASIMPGDIIAFGGKGRASNIIKFYTGSVVSHVAICLRSDVFGLDNNGKNGGYYNEIIEATTLDGRAEVTRRRLSRRIENYEGDIWWLPLSSMIRKKLNVGRMQSWLWRQDSKPYDYFQAIMSAIDFIPDTPESYAALFCSELAAGGLKYGGGLPVFINPSEIHPLNLCQFQLYQGHYQIKGEKNIAIKGVNSIDPTMWT